MIEKDNLDKTNAWPFVEAKKLLRERKSFIEKKGKITLQTGYGPSGLPHIGTFGEVARTSMLVNALNQLSDLPTEIITFSDDMDGLRKVPDNVPNQKLLNDNLHKPLTQVPDPFEKFNSFGEHNNEMLKNFLDSFKFKYNFQSSTSLYKSGFFNPTLKIILDNYEGIMNIIIPTLGKERQQTYSPFLPICPDTGHVLEIPVKEINLLKNGASAVILASKENNNWPIFSGLDKVSEITKTDFKIFSKPSTRLYRRMAVAVAFGTESVSDLVIKAKLVASKIKINS